MSSVCSASSTVAWLPSGLGERALKLMTERALARTAFRKLIAEQGAFRKQLAECRIELDAARYVTDGCVLQHSVLPQHA